ncbi:MAG: hypothetical protein NW206_09690 [Hyphomonadaceae bacterium]|nr:hypothetical protein [Hyphomonadaceae bacterium]
MRKSVGVALIAFALSGCGGGDGGAGAGPDPEVANNPACMLVADPADIFGENADIVGYEGPAPIAASCGFTSADGTRSGDVVLFTTQTMGAISRDGQVAALVESWDAATETPLELVAELGEGAQLAKDLPGYQTQIVFTKGDDVIAVLGSSGDAVMSGEQIARALAAAANAAP